MLERHCRQVVDQITRALMCVAALHAAVRLLCGTQHANSRCRRRCCCKMQWFPTLDATSEAVVLFACESLCHRIRYLHGRGVMHRDVKPENILVVEEGVSCRGCAGRGTACVGAGVCAWGAADSAGVAAGVSAVAVWGCTRCGVSPELQLCHSNVVGRVTRCSISCHALYALSVDVATGPIVVQLCDFGLSTFFSPGLWTVPPALHAFVDLFVGCCCRRLLSSSSSGGGGGGAQRSHRRYTSSIPRARVIDWWPSVCARLAHRPAVQTAGDKSSCSSSSSDASGRGTASQHNESHYTIETGTESALIAPTTVVLTDVAAVKEGGREDDNKDKNENEDVEENEDPTTLTMAAAVGGKGFDGVEDWGTDRDQDDISDPTALGRTLVVTEVRTRRMSPK
jgi:hypothetical protein